MGYDRNKWLYVPDYYTDYRYILGTAGKRPLICIGINPSTAEPDHLDNTLKSVERIAGSNGFDSFIMFNVYPQRATNPDDMHAVRDDQLHEENMLQFRQLLERNESPVVWAAWGNLVEKRPYLWDCLRDMVRIGKDCGGQWVRAGAVSKKGHPHHPLYLKKDEKVIPFDMDLYLATH